MSCPNAERKAALRAAIQAMLDTLSGCDWCCGGGDEQMEALNVELEALERAG